MKLLLIYILSFLWGCTPHNSNRNNSNTVNLENTKTSYEFEFDQLTVRLKNEKQTRSLNGRLILYENEIHVFQGNQGEKFYIKDIQKENSQLTIKTQNNKKDRAVFKIFEKQNKSNIEVDLEGVRMVFSIISGGFDEIDLYNTLENSAKKQNNGSSINYCDCQKIHRDDGTKITQCISLPVVSNSNLEFGMAIASNELNYFITTTIRFAENAKEINGNLSIRLKDNNLMSFELVNKELAYIGNSEVSQAVFSLDDDDINKLKSSELLTVSLQLNKLISSWECNANTSILKEQLICLTQKE